MSLEEYLQKERVVRKLLNALNTAKTTDSTYSKKKHTILRHVSSLRKYVVSIGKKEIEELFSKFHLQVTDFFIKRESGEAGEVDEEEETEEEEDEEAETEEEDSEESEPEVKMAHKLDLG